MISRAIMAMGAVQMGLSIYMGYFIPEEYHYMFAFSARDFFCCFCHRFVWSPER